MKTKSFTFWLKENKLKQELKKRKLNWKNIKKHNWWNIGEKYTEKNQLFRLRE